MGILLIVLLLSSLAGCRIEAFLTGHLSHRSSTRIFSDPDWNGEVTSAEGGKISGCSILLKDGSQTEWSVTIDGVEADLGKFSEAVFKKVSADARQQRFQGFRPGTIPPHLQPTYRAFAMDECARETVLEALQQNNIRPFEQTRVEMRIEQVSIPPPPSGKKKKRKRRKTSPAESVEAPIDAVPQWREYEDMKGAIDAGWKPGQSFSFVATGVKGQQVKSDDETGGATPLGLNY